MRELRLSIDSFSAFVEYIKDLSAQNLALQSGFLHPLKVEAIDIEAQRYEVIDSFCWDPFQVIRQKYNSVQRKPENEKTRAESLCEVEYLKITNKLKNYRFFINQLNGNPGVFTKLIELDPDNRVKIESIHDLWETRSYFAFIPSASFHKIAEILHFFYDYSTLIQKKNLPALNLDMYQFSGLFAMKKALQKFIVHQKALLSTAMLSRLELAKFNRADDVVLMSLEDLEKAGLDADYVSKAKNNLFENDRLSNDLCYEFKKYVRANGNHQQKQFLENLYQSFPCLPVYASIPEESSFHKAVHHTGKCWDSLHAGSLVKNKHRFQDCSFNRANFFASDFQQSTFKNSHFHAADLSNTNFQKAIFHGCDLDWTRAIKTCFDSAIFVQTSFQAAIFLGASFNAAVFKRADFRGATLHACTFDNASGSCLFDGADFTEVSMIGADLASMSFNDASLGSVQFFRDLHLPDADYVMDNFFKRITDHPNRDLIIPAALWNILDHAKKSDSLMLALGMLDLCKKCLLRNTPFTFHSIRLFSDVWSMKQYSMVFEAVESTLHKHFHQNRKRSPFQVLGSD